ncbi:MAG: hypothetical protein GC162_07070 [Planctomycetes bacterium]|nr:hypothetical protein [Planctomycetota bacterium]
MTRRAFTIIELLLATALAVVLMAGSMKVLAALKADATTDTSATSTATIERTIIDLMQHDLVESRLLGQQQGTITMIGYASIPAAHTDDASRESAGVSHEPVKIEYFVRSMDDRSWLVRRQTRINERSNRNRWSELVCAGVTGIRIERVVPAGVRQDDPMIGTDATPTPDRVRVIVEGDVNLDVKVDVR